MELLERIRGAGLQIKLGSNGNLLVAGTLTERRREIIRQNKATLIAALQRERPCRAIVEYRIEGHPRWLVMLGRPGQSYETAAAACRRQFPDVVETRPRAAPQLQNNGPEAA